MPKGGLILLLDGFDEIGSQTWSDDPKRLKEIRYTSLLGVRDLIQNTTSGLLIAGREYYFNSDSEMFDCLGLDPEKTILVQCQDEFTNDEMVTYLKNISLNVTLPKWLPRRPLIGKIASDIDPNVLSSLLKNDRGEVDFWEHFIRAICEREAKINPSLDAPSIKNILCEVASITRTKGGDLGPITVTELNQAFETVIGKRPSDESSIILQRLPTMGRVSSESPDRQFVDPYILDGLRADDLFDHSSKKDENLFNKSWINPLRRFGITLLASDIDWMDDDSSYITYMHKASKSRNNILVGDFAAALCTLSDDLDYNNLLIQNSHIYHLDFSDKNISNLSIVDTVIEELDLTNTVATNVKINNCLIKYINGFSSPHGLPKWMVNNDIEHYQSMSTVSRIRASKLTKQQKMFLTIIKKTFFQPGAGRKEEALLRGWGAQSDKKMANHILGLLLKEGVLTRFKGDEGWVYHPERSFAQRMGEIRDQLTYSNDPIWKKLDNL